MSRARTIALLAVVTAAAVGAAFVSQQREDVIPDAGELLFPGLLERVNDVRVITGLTAGEKFDIELADGRWVVRGKDGYPADADKVHLLIVGAAGLRRIEPKTANPDLYSRIGLEDPSAPGAGSMRLVIKDGGSAALADFVIGRRRASKTTLDDEEIYVRVGDEPVTWLVQGKLPKPGGALDWVEESVVTIPEKRIYEVDVVHPDGEIVRLRKAAADDVDYALVDLPADQVIDGQWKLNDIGRSFSQFELEDVRAASLDTVGGEPDVRAEMRTYDGLVVTLDTRTVDGITYGAFGARFDAALAGAPAAGGEEGLEPAEVEAQAARLDAAWSPWVFELPSYRVDYLRKRRDDMLKAPDEAGTPLPGPTSAPRPGLMPGAIPGPIPGPVTGSAPGS